MNPCPSTSLEIDRSALILGGGMAGMVAAKNLADQGYESHIVENEATLWAGRPEISMTT